MDNKSLATLILLNVVLIAGLAVVALTPQPAQAQLRGRGEYTMLSGRTKSRSNADVIYLADLNSGKLAAIIYESQNERLTDLGRFDLSHDLEGAGNAR